MYIKLPNWISCKVLGNYFWNLGTPVFIFFMFSCFHYWDLITNNWRFINCRHKRTLLSYYYKKCAKYFHKPLFLGYKVLILFFSDLLDNGLVSLMNCSKPEIKVGQKDPFPEMKERRSKIANVLKNADWKDVKKSDGELLLFCNLYWNAFRLSQWAEKYFDNSTYIHIFSRQILKF